MENKKPTLNKSLLSPEQRDKLDNWQQNHDQLRTLEDIANMMQETLSMLGGDVRPGGTTMKDVGSLLLDIRESLMILKDKEDPETPDFALPIVEAIKKLTNEINNLDIKPNVNVDSPQVNVSTPKVDMKGIEKAVAGIPPAFKEAMMMMPMPEKPDFSPLLSAWEDISQQLVSIENATRMKPLPGTMAVSNLPITNGKVDVNATVTATVDTTGLATDTIQTNGTQKTQVVDAGGEAVTVTGGKLDVNASVDTTGLATSAKQLPDGHNVVVTSMPAVSIDTTGLATSAKQDTGNTSVGSIDTKTPALGQALAAASVPVILPSATVTTLTPPAAITGFATATKQDTQDTSINTLLKPASTLAAVTTLGTVTNVVHVDDNAGSITVDGTVAVTNAGITTIAGAVAGTEMQVDVLTMPTVTVNAHAVTNAGTFAVQTTSAITGIGHGVKVVTTAGTDVALAGSTACKRVIIQAQTDNTSLIAVGGSGVDATIATGTGIVLQPGDAFEMDIDNLADVYIDSLVNGEGCRFTYWT